METRRCKTNPTFRLRLIFLLIPCLFYSFSISINAQDWTPLEPPNTPEARFGPSLVTLPDGRVVMFGGQGENDALFNDLNIFRDTWTPVTPGNDPPPERKNHSAWAVDDKMYIHGGAGSSLFYDDLWSYDVNNNTWTQLQPSGEIPEARESTSSFLYNGDLYLLGGQGESSKFSDVWYYNINENSWKKWGHSPTTIAGAAAFVYGDQLFVSGKYSVTFSTDLTTKVWRDFQSNPMPGPRSNAVSVQNGQIAFLMGGEGSVLQDMWSFDMVTETWSQLVDLPIPLKYASAAIYDNQIFLYGGLDDNDSINSLSWVYRFAPSSVANDIIDTKFELNNNYPNPFNPSTRISYSIVKRGLVTLTVFNSIGEKIDVLVNEIKEPGLYEITYDAKNLPSGIYFYTLKSEDQTQTKKMMVLR